MSKRTIVKIVIFFIGIVLPILAMLNCQGFDEGSMAVETCYIDSDFIRSYASFYYGWLLISAFMVFIPVIIYIAFVIGIAMLIARMFKK